MRHLFGLRPTDPVYGGLQPLRRADIDELVRFARQPVSSSWLARYECYLGYYLEPGARHDRRFRGDHPSPRILRGFPEARRTKPRTPI